jgi:hypothetical protein
MTDVVNISQGFNRQLVGVVRRDLRRGRRSRDAELDLETPGNKPSRFSRHQAILLTDLRAAVNTKRDPSTAQVAVLKRKPNGDLTRSSLTLTIVNRFINISIDAGTYVKIEHIDGEWQPYAADCPGGSLSESL